MIINGRNYLTKQDLSKRFGVSLSTVNRLAASRFVPLYRFRRRVYFAEEDVDAWLAVNVQRDTRIN